MSFIIATLPSNYVEIVDLKNYFNSIAQEFGKDAKYLILTYDDDSFVYYKKNLNYLNLTIINFFKKDALLTKELLLEVYECALDINQYRVVIFRDIENNISIKYAENTEIQIYMWSALNGRLRRIQDETNEEEDSETNSNIFAQISKHNRSQYILTPYGYTVRHSGYGYINELGFRIPKDYQKLKTREKHHKLICFFGNSSCFSMRVRDNELFTSLLENQLNDYFNMISQDTKVTILNFGMMGHLVLNEIYTYIAFAQELKPDMVFAHHLINDLVSGMTNDNLLLKKFNFNYHFLFEDWSLQLHKNDVVQQDKIPIRNKINTADEIIEAYYARDKQFKVLVENEKIPYVSIIQPVSFSKKELSKREKQGIAFYIDKMIIEEEPFIKNMYSQLIDMLKNKGEYDRVIDIHTAFGKYGASDDLFVDWIHTNANGDRIISELIFKYLINNNLINKI